MRIVRRIGGDLQCRTSCSFVYSFSGKEANASNRYQRVEYRVGTGCRAGADALWNEARLADLRSAQIAKTSTSMIETSQDPTRDPLDVVAGKILTFWKRADDQRVFAAMLLKEAKERVEAGEDARFGSFPQWCRECLPGRSNRDIRRLLQIANAPDPKSMLNKMRAKTREDTRGWREKTRTDSRESAIHGETVSEPDASDAGSDRKIFARFITFLTQKQHLPLGLRISMAHRLVDALGVDLADLQDRDIRAAA
jgi:hypothetical protein